MSSRYQDALESPGFLLWLATLRWQRLMRSTLRPHGLTHVQFVILASLWWLTEHGARPSQRELADHAGTDLTMTSQVLRVLERQGHIVREPSPQDARTRCLGLTAQGRRVVLGALPEVEEADRRFLDPVSDVTCFTQGLRGLTTKYGQRGLWRGTVEPAGGVSSGPTST